MKQIFIDGNFKLTFSPTENITAFQLAKCMILCMAIQNKGDLNLVIKQIIDEGLTEYFNSSMVK